jgi:RNA polymerase sigma-70 factor (ECF subfamily)
MSQLEGRGEDHFAEWEGFVKELLPRLYHYFCYRVGDGRVAEDLSAETFERAWVGRSGYQSKLGLRSQWIFGIARRVAADHFRRRKAAMQLNASGPIANEQSAEEASEQRAEFARLSELLRRLRARERELVALKYGAELTNREIARVTGLSESNVGTILHRVVARLRAEWDGDA